MGSLPVGHNGVIDLSDPRSGNEFLQSTIGKAKRGLIRGRSKGFESGLTRAGCNGGNSFFSGTDEEGNELATILNGRNATTPEDAICQLDEALATCNGCEAGMIHLPTGLAGKGHHLTESSYVDYGDGMGCRRLNRTKTRGNIVVAGTGYSAIGPGEDELSEDCYWGYASSMVRVISSPLIIVATAGQALDAVKYSSNDVIVFVEQLVIPVYDPCCLYAIKITKECVDIPE